MFVVHSLLATKKRTTYRGQVVQISHWAEGRFRGSAEPDTYHHTYVNIPVCVCKHDKKEWRYVSLTGDLLSAGFRWSPAAQRVSCTSGSNKIINNGLSFLSTPCKKRF